jgi:ribosomal protein L40E
MQQPFKVCSRCGQRAVLTMARCGRCGHPFASASPLGVSAPHAHSMPGPQPSQTAFCLRCGAVVAATDAFCRSCGLDLRSPHLLPVSTLTPHRSDALPTVHLLGILMMWGLATLALILWWWFRTIWTPGLLAFTLLVWALSVGLAIRLARSRANADRINGGIWLTICALCLFVLFMALVVAAKMRSGGLPGPE